MADLLTLIAGLHWREHRFSLALFAMSIGVFVLGFKVFLSSEDQFAKSSNNLIQQKNTNAHAEGEIILFDSVSEPYAKLVEKGVVGGGQRLQWLETIQNISDDYGIPKISFVLGNSFLATEQADYYWSPELRFQKTNIEVIIDLLHEGDFYSFLQAFHQQANGLFSVERCHILRKAADDELAFMQGLRAECLFSAYVFDDVTLTDETLL